MVECENGASWPSERPFSGRVMNYEIRGKFEGTCIIAVWAYNSHNKVIAHQERQFFASSPGPSQN